MRIGICIAGNAAIGAIPVLDLVRGIECLGHHCKVFATSQDGSIPDSLYIEATSSQLNDTHWWASQGLQLVFVYSLHFPLDAVVAAKRAGVTVILDCDSDGRISPAIWPLDHMRRYRDECHSIVTRARVAKLWLRDILFSKRYEESSLALLLAVDLIRIESHNAASNLVKLARYRSLNEIENKIRVVPFCAPSEVCEILVPTAKKQRVVIAGRLNAAQKNPRVLAKVIEQICSEIPDAEFDCFSRGDCYAIRDLGAKYSDRVSYHVDATKEQVRDALRTARVLLSTSRWETLPLIGIEALCMGCTIVAPPLDGYLELCGSAQFGTVAQSFAKADICRAFHEEWGLWEANKRDPLWISRSARDKYKPVAVAGRLLDISFGQAIADRPLSERC